jgi:DNA-binding NarL/FixJ family response regulator
MAFRMHHSHQLYQLLDEAPGLLPDLAIVDVDSVDGWNAWHDFRAEHPHLPALIVTTTPPGGASSRTTQAGQD